MYILSLKLGYDISMILKNAFFAFKQKLLFNHKIIKKMNSFITTPSLIILSIVGYVFLSIVITRYMINGGKNEKDIIEKNKINATKKKSFLKKYPEADIQTARNFTLALGFIFAFAGSIFAFSLMGEAEKPIDFGENTLKTSSIIDILPPIRAKKTSVEKVVPPPPPPLKKDPNPTIVTTPKKDFVASKTPKAIAIDQPNEIINNNRNVEYVEPELKVTNFAEKMPKFKGCENLDEEAAYHCTMQKIQEFIATIKYPDYAFDNGIEGKVYVSFVVNSKGEIYDLALPGKADKSLNRASLKHLKKMPAFATGGSQGGKNVNVKFNVPIVFKLNN